MTSEKLAAIEADLENILIEFATHGMVLPAGKTWFTQVLNWTCALIAALKEAQIREKGYLSELADYARTVARLNAIVLPKG